MDQKYSYVCSMGILDVFKISMLLVIQSGACFGCSLCRS